MNELPVIESLRLCKDFWDRHRANINKSRIARTVVRALGISARCIRMEFVHSEGMGLTTFVNVRERTYIVKNKVVEDLVR